MPQPHTFPRLATARKILPSVTLAARDASAHQFYGSEILTLGGSVQEALAEANLAHQLDPLSTVISVQIGDIYNGARQFDDAIAVCKKLADENPTFASAHYCLAEAYWGRRMYPQVIEEWKTWGELSGDRNESEFASALEEGFRSAGWKDLLRVRHFRQSSRIIRALPKVISQLGAVSFLLISPSCGSIVAPGFGEPAAPQHFAL